MKNYQIENNNYIPINYFNENGLSSPIKRCRVAKYMLLIRDFRCKDTHLKVKG